MDQRQLERIGKDLRKRREAKTMTLSDLSYEIRPFLPRAEWVTGEAIRAYEKGTVKHLNLVLLIAIGRALGFTLTDLSPDLADDADRIRDLLESGIRCSLPLAG